MTFAATTRLLNAFGQGFAQVESNDRGTEHLLHHTLGTHDLLYTLDIAKKLTCAAVSITSADDAPGQIDHAIRRALCESKPAYIEIACNIAGAHLRRAGTDQLGAPERNRVILKR